MPQVSAQPGAAPNTYWDSGGHDTKVAAAVPSQRPAWPDAHSFPRSRPLKAAGSSTDRCPVGAGSGAGQTPIDTVPGGFGGRGNALRVTPRCHIAHQVAGFGRAHFWDWPQGHEPVSASPVLRLRRFIPRMFTWVKPSVPLRGLLSWWASRSRSGRVVVGEREGSASHPSGWLPALRPPTPGSNFE
jgi:hypothetical protein